jgi:hypothetical protein
VDLLFPTLNLGDNKYKYLTFVFKLNYPNNESCLNTTDPRFSSVNRKKVQDNQENGD